LSSSNKNNEVMTKKFIITTVAFLILALSAGAFLAYKNLKIKRAGRQHLKAGEIKVTIIEGWTIDDIAKDLNYNKQRAGFNHLASTEEFVRAEKEFDTGSYSFLESKPPNADLEGFLFPDTYFLPENFSSTTNISQLLVKKALSNFSQKFTPALSEQAKLQGFSVYQILILASILEKETGRNTVTTEQKMALDEERKMVAGIFYNRLRINMPLASDATINYITKKNTPSATAEDIKINSPYNTYQNKGLPPTPICNPSLSSILAALYPTPNDYFFFLHTQPSGKIIYSKTFEEHLKNKQRYLK
jgi:UPF0755 protein